MTSATKKLNWHGANYGWLVEAEKFAREAFDTELDLSYYKEMRWGSALKVFYQNPTIQNLEVVKEIYNKCGEKKHYRQVAIRKFRNQMSKEKARSGRKKLAKQLIRMPLSVIRKLNESSKNEVDSQSVSIIKSFS